MNLSQSTTVPSQNLSLLQRGKPKSSWALIRRLFQGYLQPHFGGFAAAAVFMAVAAAATAALAYMIKPIVNELGQGRPHSYVLGMAGLVLAIFAVNGFATYFHTVIMNRIGQRIVTNVQQSMHRHLLGADLSFFHANASGTLISRLTNDVGIMRQAVGECLTSSFKGGLKLVFLIGLMFYQDWKLSCAAFFVFPLSALFVAQIGKHMRRYSTRTFTDGYSCRNFLM